MHAQASINFAGRELSIETGAIAKQADGSVLVRYGDNIILVTVVADQDKKIEELDMLPLTVNYQEKFYAGGKIPGGFFKREGRPTEAETLNSRLIDRAIRPLFPKGWRYDTQVMATVLSVDVETHPGMLCLNGASAALEISDIPFNGPVAAVQVGRIDGQFVINPKKSELEKSELDLVVAGNREGVLMVEGGARMVPEELLLEAIFYAYEQLKPLLELQESLRRDAGKPKRDFESAGEDDGLLKLIRERYSSEMLRALCIRTKSERRNALRALRVKAGEELSESYPELKDKPWLVLPALEQLERETMRKQLFETGTRIDGRKPDEIRQIKCEVGVLPRTHGSALFTRGETQALVVTTLGTREDERKIEHVDEEFFKSFYLHYNFPPFSVGETSGRLAPGRREIGHGALAERALVRVIPSHTDFPYTIRIVSDILESNGSSSMATVCGGSLSLMDAGVPIKEHIAGIAMGLAKESDDKFHILTDIMGDEDHCGDMDFKVAGTYDGVTAVQMDIKIPGISKEILRKALEQAREGRRKILDQMKAVIPAPRPELSPYAPRIVTIQIPVDKIKDVIGPGGKMIREIVEKTGATIEVEDDGTINIASVNGEANEKAIQMIKALTQEVELNGVYKGVVKRIEDYGAFVEILPGVTGLMHISQFAHQRTENPRSVLKIGDEVEVKVIGLEDNRISLSRKALMPRPEGTTEQRDRTERRNFPHNRSSGARKDDRGGFRSTRDHERGGRPPRSGGGVPPNESGV